MSYFVVVIWEPGADVASDRFVGPWRSEERADRYAADVRSRSRYDARVEQLDRPNDLVLYDE